MLSNYTALDGASQLEAILSHKGHLATSGDIFGCHPGRDCYWHHRVAAKHATVHRAHSQELSGPKHPCAEVGNLQQEGVSASNCVSGGWCVARGEGRIKNFSLTKNFSERKNCSSKIVN